jgi:2-oxo-4-hydroxy-4-carboxy-5-ureidoimidazoline decarboxylase
MMNDRLAEWNRADREAAIGAMIACCGSHRWAAAMVALRPIPGVVQLSEAADRVWCEMEEVDLLEAFASHPRIGERSPSNQHTQHVAWSRQEQSSVIGASQQALTGLAEKNLLYEQRFGFTYIVCATGKTAKEMLAILNRRLTNDRTAEIREAAEQQRQITQTRLGKWLAS